MPVDEIVHVDLLDGFSALQRAENSSIVPAHLDRKSNRSFSALQRAENSSIGVMAFQPVPDVAVSVLFSEPKIPQYPTSFISLPFNL